MIYDLLAPFYDAINADIDYKEWADFIEEILKKECKGSQHESLLVTISMEYVFLSLHFHLMCVLKAR